MAKQSSFRNFLMDVGVDDDEEGAGEEVKKERGNEAMAVRADGGKWYNAVRGEQRRRLWRASNMAGEVWCGRDLNRSEMVLYIFRLFAG